MITSYGFDTSTSVHLELYILHKCVAQCIGTLILYIYLVNTNTNISYSTIVLYSKDHKGVGVAHEKNQPTTSLTSH